MMADKQAHDEQQKHDDRLQEFMDRSIGKRTYVRQIKADAEKQQRTQRKAAAKKRRQDTLMRKSEPLTKIRKMEKKSRRLKNKRKGKGTNHSNEDVESHHRMVQEQYNMQMHDPKVTDIEWYNIYNSNYENWSLMKTRAICSADAEDTRYTNKLRAEQAKKEREKQILKHKKNMEETLRKIDPDFTVKEKKKKSTGKLVAFFKRAPGFHVGKVERFYNSIYFSMIVGSKIRVHNLPDINDDEAVSDCAKEPPGEYECDHCGSEMIIDQKMGQVSCSSCGVSKQGGFGVGLKQTFSESQASSRSAAPYERLSHVSNAFLKPSSYPLLKAIHLRRSISPVVIVTNLPPGEGQGFAFFGRGRMYMFPTVY